MDSLVQTLLTYEKRLKHWLDAAVVLATGNIVAVVARALTYSPLSYDESGYIYGGYSFLHGLVPYRDFHNQKGPFVSFTQAAAIKLFGIEQQGFRRFVPTLAVIGISFVTAALIQRGVRRLLAFASAMAITATWFDSAFHDTSLNDAEGVVLIYFFLGLGCLLLRSSSRMRVAALLFAGGFFGAATLTKENFVLVCAPSWLVFLFAEKRPERMTYVKWTVTGAVAVAVVVFGYLATHGALGPYVELLRATAKFSKNYCAKLGIFTVGTFWQDRRQELQHLYGSLCTLPRIAAWGPLVFATIACTDKRNALVVVTAFLTVAATLVTISMGHCFWQHYFTMAAAGLAVLAVPGMDALSVRDCGHTRRAVAVGIIAVAGPLYSVLPRYTRWMGVSPQPVALPVAPRVREAVERYSNPGDYILTTSTPELYFLTGRLGAHVEMNVFVDDLLDLYPGITDVERVARMRQRLEETRPKVVVVDSGERALPRRSTRTLRGLVFPYLADHRYVAIDHGLFVRPDLVGANDRTH